MEAGGVCPMSWWYAHRSRKHPVADPQPSEADVLSWPPDTPTYQKAIRRLFRRQIRVLVPTIPDNFFGLDLLPDLRRKVNEPRLDVLFDFSDCKHLSQQAIAFLGGLARLVEGSRGTADFAWKTCRPKILRVLQANGFTNMFHGPIGVAGAHSVPYREYKRADPDSVVAYLGNSWLAPEWLSLTPALREALVAVVLEIYLNAFEHSQSPIGVLTCGHHDEARRTLRLIVMDFGVGIPDRVRMFTSRPTLRASTTMKWAFTPGATTNPIRDTIRGMGLHLLKEFVRLNHGELRVFSQEGLAAVKGTRERFVNRLVPFQGTLVDIMFRCDDRRYGFASELAEQPPLFG